jgi:yecA family protein
MAGRQDAGDDLRLRRRLSAPCFGRERFPCTTKPSLIAVLPVDPDAADISAEESLRDLLCDRPPAVTSFEVLSGFLTALAVCPTEIPVETFMDEIWSDERPPFAGMRDALTAEKLVHAYRQEIAGNLAMARDTDQPLLAVGFEIVADDYDMKDASGWCRGFLRVLELWPEAWRGAGQRADLRPYFEFLRAVAMAGEPDGGDIPMSAGEVPDAIGRAVLTLRAALRPRVTDESSSAQD